MNAHPTLRYILMYLRNSGELSRAVWLAQEMLHLSHHEAVLCVNELRYDPINDEGLTEPHP
jgi:predicted Rdx family selenoprotein